MLRPCTQCTGLSRLELRAKGDTNALYANLVVVILALGALWLPLMHYLTDRKGYAITLTVINTLGVICSVLQASRMLVLTEHSDIQHPVVCGEGAGY